MTTMTLEPPPHHSSPSNETAETMLWRYVVTVGVLLMILGYLVTLW